MTPALNFVGIVKVALPLTSVTFVATVAEPDLTNTVPVTGAAEVTVTVSVAFDPYLIDVFESFAVTFEVALVTVTSTVSVDAANYSSPELRILSVAAPGSTASGVSATVARPLTRVAVPTETSSATMSTVPEGTPPAPVTRTVTE